MARPYTRCHVEEGMGFSGRQQAALKTRLTLKVCILLHMHMHMQVRLTSFLWKGPFSTNYCVFALCFVFSFFFFFATTFDFSLPFSAVPFLFCPWTCQYFSRFSRQFFSPSFFAVALLETRPASGEMGQVKSRPVDYGTAVGPRLYFVWPGDEVKEKKRRETSGLEHQSRAIVERTKRRAEEIYFF